MLEVHLDGEGQAREALKDSECEKDTRLQVPARKRDDAGDSDS